MTTTTLRVCDTSQYSRESPEYRRGVRQIKEWHIQCAMKRIKAKREKILAENKDKGAK